MTARHLTAEEELPPRRTSIACLKRLPSYLQMLRSLQKEGREYVSSAVLAEVHNLEPVIVRKDLAETGVVGTPRLGFPIDPLVASIEQFLGWDHPTRAVVVGCGNLGTALLGYNRFGAMGLELVGAFDSDPSKAGMEIQGRKVQPMGELASFVAARGIILGLLATPADAAQEAASLMAQAGIRGIWNFAPVKLRLPDGVVVQKEDLAEGLAVLLHRVHQSGPFALSSTQFQSTTS